MGCDSGNFIHLRKYEYKKRLWYKVLSTSKTCASIEQLTLYIAPIIWEYFFPAEKVGMENQNNFHFCSSLIGYVSISPNSSHPNPHCLQR